METPGQDLVETLGSTALHQLSNVLMVAPEFTSKIEGLLIKAGLYGKAVYDFTECVDTVKNVCSEKYNTWNNAPYTAQNQCHSAITTAAQATDQIQDLERELAVLSSDNAEQRQFIRRMQDRIRTLRSEARRLDDARQNLIHQGERSLGDRCMASLLGEDRQTTPVV